MIVLVLCHTILNDAFRNYPGATTQKLKEQESAKFIIRYLIETKGNGSISAITSEQVMKSLEYTLPNQGIGGFPAQIILGLKNLIISVDGKVQNLGESVTVISDIVASKIEDAKLVSNMSRKKLDVIEFYQKYEPSSRKIKEDDIPFDIITSCDIEEYLRRTDPTTCGVIDERVGE